MKKGIAILGSTGSIGTQALEVINEQRDKFHVEVLTANNSASLLIKQAKIYKPNSVVIVNDNKYKKVFSELSPLNIKVYSGAKSLQQIVDSEKIDIVLTALVGYAGLLPTINAIKCGKKIALANKETLVVAGELISKLARENNSEIVPVDSVIDSLLSAANQ